MQDFMNGISHIAHTTMPNNPQSKTVESVFGRFQQQVLHQVWGYTGQNVTAKKAGSKPNLELIGENRDMLPTLEELKEKYIELREMWNGEREMPTTRQFLKHHKTGIGRMEMYLSSVNEYAPEISAEEMAESFWLWTDAPSTFKQGGIEIEVDKVRYKYCVFAADAFNTIDVEWLRRNLYRKFWVKFDPNDMSAVKLYWEDKAGGRRYERMASPPVKVHRAIQDKQEGEMAYIRSVLDANKQEQIHRFLTNREIEWKHGTAPEQNGLRTPKISGFTGDEMEEVNLMLERRTRKYRNRSLAQEHKDISMMTYDEVQENDFSESEEFNYKKVAGKL